MYTCKNVEFDNCMLEKIVILIEIRIKFNTRNLYIRIFDFCKLKLQNDSGIKNFGKMNPFMRIKRYNSSMNFINLKIIPK